jgi:hypothetical protein
LACRWTSLHPLILAAEDMPIHYQPLTKSLGQMTMTIERTPVMTETVAVVGDPRKLIVLAALIRTMTLLVGPSLSYVFPRNMLQTKTWYGPR